jgi:hypothetical protein
VPVAVGLITSAGGGVAKATAELPGSDKGLDGVAVAEDKLEFGLGV